MLQRCGRIVGRVSRRSRRPAPPDGPGASGRRPRRAPPRCAARSQAARARPARLRSRREGQRQSRSPSPARAGAASRTSRQDRAWSAQPPAYAVGSPGHVGRSSRPLPPTVPDGHGPDHGPAAASRGPSALENEPASTRRCTGTRPGAGRRAERSRLPEGAPPEARTGTMRCPNGRPVASPKPRAPPLRSGAWQLAASTFVAGARSARMIGTRKEPTGSFRVAGTSSSATLGRSSTRSRPKAARGDPPHGSRLRHRRPAQAPAARGELGGGHVRRRSRGDAPARPGSAEGPVFPGVRARDRGSTSRHARDPACAPGHPKAVETFKQQTTPSNEAGGGSSLTSSGQFYWRNLISDALEGKVQARSRRRPRRQRRPMEPQGRRPTRPPAAGRVPDAAADAAPGGPLHPAGRRTVVLPMGVLRQALDDKTTIDDVKAAIRLLRVDANLGRPPPRGCRRWNPLRSHPSTSPGHRPWRRGRSSTTALGRAEQGRCRPGPLPVHHASDP